MDIPASVRSEKGKKSKAIEKGRGGGESPHLAPKDGNCPISSMDGAETWYDMWRSLPLNPPLGPRSRPRPRPPEP